MRTEGVAGATGTRSTAEALGTKGAWKPDLARAMRALRTAPGAGTTLGGYGELHYQRDVPAGGPASAEIDLRRLVLFVAHNFTDSLRFYSEIEVEHAVVSTGLPGEVSVEQGTLDWDLIGKQLTLRSGVILVPMGIVNQWHEPPSFNGVTRPAVETMIIPSTWREGGVGFLGEPVEGIRYEAYVMAGGLNPQYFSATNGIAGGKQTIGEARANGLAVTGRLEFEPKLGFLMGLSGYYARTGPNAAPSAGLTADVPVLGVAADARMRWEGLEARAVATTFSIGDTQALRSQPTDPQGIPTPVDAGSHIYGAYGELGYNVFQPVGLDHELVPFVRVERLNTMWKTEGTPISDVPGTTYFVPGITYRPVPQVAFKADVIFTTPDAGSNSKLYQLGVGWMF